MRVSAARLLTIVCIVSAARWPEAKGSGAAQSTTTTTALCSPLLADAAAYYAPKRVLAASDTLCVVRSAAKVPLWSSKWRRRCRSQVAGAPAWKDARISVAWRVQEEDERARFVL